MISFFHLSAGRKKETKRGRRRNLEPSLSSLTPTPKKKTPKNQKNSFSRLLCVEHVEEHSKPVLYLVFEFLQTDLKKWMDRNGKGPAHPLR
jgi:hypothetical protein